MKNYLLFILIIFTSFCFSQQKSFSIDWSGSRTMATESSSIIIPSFNKDALRFTYDRGLKYAAEWTENDLIDENSVTVSNISTTIINDDELYQLERNKIPNSLSLQLVNTSARGKNAVYIEFSPIFDDNGVFKRVNNITISYNSRQNRSSRSTTAISNSVLAQGDWHRFYVDTTGVFKITRSFLSDLGVNTNVDPRTIKIYGQGGRMLPLVNSTFYPFDLTENAIRFVGEDDGVFNNDDFILMYAEGPHGYNSESNTHNNIFTDKSYYYVNVSPGFGKRIQPYVEPAGDPNITINTFNEYQYYESDEFNLARLGRRWFGNRFDFDSDKVFEFDFPRLVTSEPVQFKLYAAAVGEVNTSMTVRVNNNDVDTFFFDPIDDPILGDDDFFNGNINVNSSLISVALSFNNSGNPASLGYLDYISIEAVSSLDYIGEQFQFKYNDAAFESGIGEYVLSNAANVSEVWDVTDRFNITAISNNDSNSTLNFKSQLGQLRIFQVVDPSDVFEPGRDSNTTVGNQNLKGTLLEDAQGQFQPLDYLIVTRQDMFSQAERLAQINRDQYGLKVKVVSLDEVYHEFSSGNPDVGAIRNMVRYIYDNVDDPDQKIKYLCLFGDASYDYKDRISNNTNVVPSWHSYNSFSLSGSFVADDFFGMMDPNEGTMIPSDRLDLAVGRILADTPQRAKEMVDKIKDYYAPASYGSWRNNFITISDDVDESWETILQSTTDEIGNIVTADKPFVNVTKIHSDSYQQESTAGGQRYPDVNKAIFDAMEVGALVVNYFGHGGEDGLARERIWDKNNVQEINNVCKLPLFVTVTCEYTKFDNPNRPTAGEFLYWNKDAGAIGLITTTRQIFVSVGVAMNIILKNYLFALGSNDYPSMAEALRLTKNDPGISSIEQRRLIFFIGDPAMKLAFPKPDVRLTRVNDVPVSDQIQTLEALGYAKIDGEVIDEGGNVLTDYNGVLTATIYDKEIERSTLANDGTTEGGQLIVLDYTTLGEVIFRGQASVTNGQFSFDFIVPRDIGIPVGNGKVSFYSKNEAPLQNQAGASFEIQIGGLNENAAEDNEGPAISLFMNDESFVSGGITNQEPTLLAKLSDENGINTSSGIGHDIVAILDGDETNPFKLNDYYVANVDDYTKGALSYPFRDLEPGLHTLTLKAWDVYNNSSTSEIQFVVFDENEELVIRNVLNYPNPFVNYTEFWFNHNSSEVLDVSIQIFTVSGKLVKTINGQTSGGSKNTSSVSRDLVWDGLDDFGDRIGKGVYVYKLSVHSPLLNKTVEKFQKLVIL
ncbi:MAG: type IX secretion system sortase PorU [Flavobacteriaceae bacterium]|nr:type IX secretion system sortase PorU [Flavobacteriaceae bacterium]